MSVSQHVVHLDDIEPTRDGGIEMRVTFDSQNGCERLAQRVLRLDAGASDERTTGGDQEVLYVASGTGSLTVDAAEHELEPGTGVYVAPGTEYVIRARDDMTIVSVVAPDLGASSTGMSVVRFDDQEELDASPERSFRYLTDEGDLTQFIGIVQPSKAPFHSHPYDELGFIVEGEGVAHVGGEEIPLRAGSCFHLAPGEVHCIENSGDGAMRILGVFNPSDSPASRTYPDNN